MHIDLEPDHRFWTLLSAMQCLNHRQTPPSMYVGLVPPTPPPWAPVPLVPRPSILLTELKAAQMLSSLSSHTDFQAELRVEFQRRAVHALQEMGFFCPKRLRRLRLDQYSMTEQQRRGLDVQLTHNKFRKSAWKLWHDSGSAAAVTNKVDVFEAVLSVCPGQLHSVKRGRKATNQSFAKAVLGEFRRCEEFKIRCLRRWF